MATFRFSNGWRFDAPPGDVYDAIRRAERWPTWWDDIAVEQLAADRYRCELRAPLGFRLRFELHVTEEERPHRLRVELDGDLRGAGSGIIGVDGDGTRASYRARVSTARPVLDLLAPGLRVLLAWSHREAMRRAARALQAHLDDGGPRAGG